MVLIKIANLSKLKIKSHTFMKISEMVHFHGKKTHENLKIKELNKYL